MDHRDVQPPVRGGGDTEVDRTMTCHDAGFIIVRRIAFRTIPEGLDERLHDEGQVRELRLTLGTCGIEMSTQRLQLGDVHLLEVGEMWDVGVRTCHLLSDPAPKADHRNLRGVAPTAP